MRYSNQGFTLIELMLVVGIIGMLVPVATLSLTLARQRSQEVACQDNRRVIEGVEQEFKMATGRYSRSLYELVNGGYVKWDGLCPGGGVYAWVPYTERSAKYHSILGCSIHGASSVKETSSGLTDDFDDLNSEGWTEIGSWEVNDQGQYVSYGNPSRGQQRAYFGDQDLTDYDVSVTGTLDDGSRSMGLYFRMTYNEKKPQKASGYAFMYDPGRAARDPDRGAFYFVEVSNGRHTRQGQTTSWRTADEDWKWFEQEHELSVSVSGNTFIGYVDGQEVARYTDTKNPYTEGAAGLRVQRGSATFDDFSITFPGKESRTTLERRRL